MRTTFTVPLLLAIAACAGPRYAERSAPVPLPPPSQAPVRHEPLPPPDDAATRAWLDREIERNRVRSAPGPAEVRQEPAPPPGPDAATRAWLDQEIERNRYVPPPVPVEVVERIVERPVYVRESGGYYDPYYYEPYSYRPYYYGAYGHYGSYGNRSYRHTTFPVHTALGAGIGAIVGHQSGHRGRGAWIGGGLGLLMDLGSRW